MGLFLKIAKFLSFAVMRKKLKKIEKMVEEDSSLQTDLEATAKANAKLKKTMSTFCDRNPNHILCNEDKLIKDYGKGFSSER